MRIQPNWQWNEHVQVGKDYADPANVAVYDARHSRFRDIRADNEKILDLVDAAPGRSLLDMGCGTGELAIQAAQRGARVFAADVSQPMLDYARAKAARTGAAGIEFCHGGFLTYQHAAEPLDAVVSQAVLHHVPDFWKQVALLRVADMLADGGRLFLMDVVFQFDPADHERFFERVIWQGCQRVGPDYAEDMARHIREEFSTTDWIMEGLLARAGFRIDRADYRDGGFATYLCTKTPRGNPS